MKRNIILAGSNKGSSKKPVKRTHERKRWFLGLFPKMAVDFKGGEHKRYQRTVGLTWGISRWVNYVGSKVAGGRS